MTNPALFVSLARKRIRRLIADDSAATAAITLVLMIVLLGFLGLVVDAGMLFVERTEMQKAVDAAAIAGAYDYKITSSGCSQTNNAADAQAYFAQNHMSTYTDGTLTETTTIAHNGPPSSPPNLGGGTYCFWQVSAQRSGIPLIFGSAFVGRYYTNAVAATAIAYKSPVAGVSNPVPYALWGGNTDNYAPDATAGDAAKYDIGDADGGLNQNGTVVTFKSNNWTNIIYPDPQHCGGRNQPPCNGNWIGNPSNSFKGYLHINNSPNVFYSIGSTVDSNSGNANASNLCAMAKAGQAGAVLIATPACNLSTCPPPLKNPPSGQTDFYVAAIRAVYLNQNQVCSPSFVGNDAGGTICLPSVDPKCVVSGGKGGGTDPNAPDVVKLVV